MKALFFDTETTGLPQSYDLEPHEYKKIPRLVQISGSIYDNEIKENEFDFIIKTDFKIPLEASRIHGITDNISQEKGILINDAIQFIFENKFDFVVCHNYNFDRMIFLGELYRNENHNLIQIFDDKKHICTMLESMKFVGIKNYYGYKYPKLSELHEKLFDVNFENAHNSKNDIEATVKCFFELKKRGIIKI